MRKIWLTEFYEFCQTALNDSSKMAMGDLLNFESDLQSIQIISNSLSYGGNAVGRETERKKYMSRIGYLYPDFSLRLDGVTDFNSLVQALDGSGYEEMLKGVANSD